MVHASIQHDKTRASAALDRSCACNVEAGWAGEKPPGFHYESSCHKPAVGARFIHKDFCTAAQSFEVELFLMSKVWDSEPTSEINR